MDTKAKISTAHVSRVLGKRFTRSEKTTTRVRGYYNVSGGFKVTEPKGYALDYGQVVFVRYVHGSGMGAWQDYMDETPEYRAARLERYAKTLREAGYVAQVRGSFVNVSKAVES